jgi:hypothetical protein
VRRRSDAGKAVGWASRKTISLARRPEGRFTTTVGGRGRRTGGTKPRREVSCLSWLAVRGSEENGDVENQPAAVVDDRVPIDDASPVSTRQRDQVALEIYRIRPHTTVPPAGKVA